MAQEERLITIENTSEEDVSELWDGIRYTIPAGEQATYRYGVGLHFVEHQPALKVVGESRGFASDIQINMVNLLNSGGEAVDLMWDGHPYHLEPGAVARLEASLANALIIQGRSRGAKLTIEGTSEPEVPEQLEAPEEDTSTEPAPKKAKRAKKATEPAA